MPSFLTPARLTASAGFLTGLAAATTAALGVVPHDGQVYLVGQEVAGLFVTGASVAKFLGGQAGWEQQQAQHDHEMALAEQKHQHDVAFYALKPVDEPQPELLSLSDETPINESDASGKVIMEANPSTGEPARLVA